MVSIDGFFYFSRLELTSCDVTYLGTPLNNNIVELFHLLHFITPSKYGDTQAIADEYVDLTVGKIDKIRGILKECMLRRTKDIVLDLPSCNVCVVGITMTKLQREICKSSFFYLTSMY